MPADPPVRQGRRQLLLVSVSEAANAQLDLAGVLEPSVTVDAIAVAQVDGDRIRPHGIYVRGVERRAGEKPAETLVQGAGLSAADIPALGQGFVLKGTGTAFVGRTRRETGDLEPLVRLVVSAAEKGLRERFAEARAARSYPAGNVEAGRKYIEKYVPFVHYVERFYQSATTNAPGHEAEAGTVAQREQ